MKISTLQMCFKVLFLSFFVYSTTYAAQEAKIIGPEVPIYSAADFDSEVIDEVYAGEKYLISDKSHGAFYRIKLKSGKIGFIVDYELDIKGKGPLKPKDLDELFMEEAKASKSQKGFSSDDEEAEAEAEEVFGRSWSGLSLQLVNLHEETQGQTQIDDLYAVGYKKVSDLSWGVVASFQVPDYYTNNSNNKASGVHLWGDLGYSNTLAYLGQTELRLAGSLFVHASFIKLETTTRTYNLDDITIGLALEGASLFKFRKWALDVGIKYYFDKVSYAGLVVSLLF